MINVALKDELICAQRAAACTDEGGEMEMKGMPWGLPYNEFKDGVYDTHALEAETQRLFEDDDVTSKRGVYQYVLTRDEKYLNIRTFTPQMKRTAYERAGLAARRFGKGANLAKI